MGSRAKKSKKNKTTSPPLEELINTIDHQIDQVPHPYIAEGFEALLGSAARAYKSRGRQYIRFVLNDLSFALPLQNTLEIDYMPAITPLPNLPSWILGICQLRGDIVSVVDLKQIMRLELTDVDKNKKLILVKNEDFSTAIMVDHIEGMLIRDHLDDNGDMHLTKNKTLSHFAQNIILVNQQKVHLLDLAVLMKTIKL